MFCMCATVCDCAWGGLGVVSRLSHPLWLLACYLYPTCPHCAHIMCPCDCMLVRMRETEGGRGGWMSRISLTLDNAYVLLNPSLAYHMELSFVEDWALFCVTVLLHTCTACTCVKYCCAYSAVWWVSLSPSFPLSLYLSRVQKVQSTISTVSLLHV